MAFSVISFVITDASDNDVSRLTSEDEGDSFKFTLTFSEKVKFTTSQPGVSGNILTWLDSFNFPPISDTGTTVWTWTGKLKTGLTEDIPKITFGIASGLETVPDDGEEPVAVTFGPRPATNAAGEVVQGETGTPPEITSGSDATASYTIGENSDAVTTIAIIDDGDTTATGVSFSLSGSDAALFEIDSATGALSFKSAPNFEAPSDSDGNNVYELTVTVTDNIGQTDSQAISVTVQDRNDTPTGAVTLSGTATEDQTLTAGNTLADEDGLGTISYQWQRDGVDITSATNSTYTLTQADVGAVVKVVASYTDGEGTAESVSSAATAAVTNVNDAPTGAVTLSGTATEGQTLTAGNTLADEDGLGTITYQWQRDGVDITNATNSTYTLTQDDVGAVVKVVASYTDGKGTAESVTSATTAAVTNVNDTPTGAVTLSGTATEGQTLTAANTLADEDGLGTISYQWQRDGVDITGATGGTYALSQADVGATIRVVASYTDGQGTTESVTSAATTSVAEVNDAPTGAARTITLEEDGNYSFSVADFGFSDSDGNSLASVLITNPTSNGNLTLDGNAVREGDEIAADRLRFLMWEPFAGTSGSSLDTLEFRVRDTGGTEYGGTDLSVDSYTLTFNVTEAEPELLITGSDGNDVLFADAVGSEIHTMLGSDTVFAGVGRDAIYLAGTNNSIIGTMADTDGDFVWGFTKTDHFEFNDLTNAAIWFDRGTRQLNISQGDTQAQISVEGEFNAGGMLTYEQGSKAVVRFVDSLPDLADDHRLSPEEINGIVNQEFLSGRGSNFQVSLVDIGYAAFDNSLGVYEIDADGNIVDVRLLFTNTNADEPNTVGIEDVEAGHQLGFFLLRDGADTLQDLDPDVSFSFVNTAGEAGNLSDGSDLLLSVDGLAWDSLDILHSFDQAMNGDGLQHVVSGASGDGRSMVIGIEDQVSGGDYDYEDVVFHVQMSDFLIFG